MFLDTAQRGKPLPSAFRLLFYVWGEIGLSIADLCGVTDCFHGDTAAVISIWHILAKRKEGPPKYFALGDLGSWTQRPLFLIQDHRPLCLNHSQGALDATINQDVVLI